MEQATIPFFSMFSAASEVFVTLSVLYCIITNLRGKPLPVILLGCTIAFEICVNVVYMTIRASEADKSVELTTGMKIFFALHGTLSLVMILGLAVLYVLSVIDIKDGRETWFRRHAKFSWFMIFVWMLSVGSGEVIFFMRYGGALFG